MTFWVVMKIIEKYQHFNIEKNRVNILSVVTKNVLGGTSADLIDGDKILINDLLYAMMLPSGNDAAESLAVYFGNFLLKCESTNENLS